MAQNTDTASQRRARRKAKQGGGETADWASCNGDTLQDLIAIVTGLKGVVSFGYTRDGGAYYISYYVDGKQEKMYVRPSEDIDQSLLDEVESWK